MSERKVIVAGGRDFRGPKSYAYVEATLNHLVNDQDTIVSGTADGADMLGERWATENLGPGQLKIFPPKYHLYPEKPERAPIARNEEMAKYSDVLIAFWNGKSRGTKNMIQTALREGLEVHVMRYGDDEDQYVRF